MADSLLVPNVFDSLLRDRIIWLGSEVQDENANEIAAKLLLLAAEDSERDPTDARVRDVRTGSPPF